MNQEPTGIEAQVCADIANRQAFGIAKYGVTVQDNPLELRQWLQHAYEECLDQSVYLRRAMHEMDTAPPPNEQWRKTYGEVIEALAAIVNVRVPDKLFDLDAVPREPVMGQVMRICRALKAFRLPAQQQEPPDGCVVVARAILRKLGIDDDVIDTIARPTAQQQEPVAWGDEPWMEGYTVRVGRDGADCIDLIFVTVHGSTFSLYTNEAAYLRDLLNKANIPGYASPQPAQQQEPVAWEPLTNSQIMASIGRHWGGEKTSISQSRPVGQQWEQICELVRCVIRERYTSPPSSKPLTDEQAYEIGAKGGEPSEAERLLFEAWMRGHCWAVIGEWDGKTYVHAHESSGFVHGGAMATRQLWAAWRDRAALEAAHGIKGAA